MEYIYMLQHTKPDPDGKLITDCRLSISDFFVFLLVFHYFVYFCSIIPHGR